MRPGAIIAPQKSETTTEGFLKALFPWSGYIELRAFKPGEYPQRKWIRAETPKAVIEWGAEKTADGWNVYFGVAARLHLGGAKEDLKYVNAVWIDFDAEKEGISKEKAFETVMAFHLTPSIVVDSGHGLHVYWLLSSPTADFDSIEDINLGLAKTLGGDRKAYDAARILRLPGTLNYKDEENPRKVTIIYFKPSMKYSLEDFELIRERVERYDRTLQLRSKTKEFPDEIVDTVINECHFLKHCREDAKTLSEPEWYCMTTILKALGADEKIHELSKPYYKDDKRRYTPEETNRKIEHAKEAVEKYGPHTCEYIQKVLGFKCPDNCPWRGKVRSPAGIAYKLIKTRSENIIVKDGRGIRQSETIQNLLLTEIPEKIRYTNGNFYSWDGMKWKAIKDEDVAAEIQAIARSEGIIIVRETLNTLVNTLKTLRELRRDFSPRRGIPVKNGFLVPKLKADNTITWELTEPDPSNDNTYVIGTEYDPNADAPRWKQFLTEVTSEEEAHLLQEYVGIMLTPFINPHKALIIWGPGGNGKSVFANTIERLLGEENVTHLAIDELEGHKLSAIINKLAIIGHEISSTGKFIETQTFKKIVSGDPITINPKYKEPIDYRPSLKIIYVVNELPRVSDISDGFFRRLLIVQFPNRIPEEKIDLFLEDTLSKELPGILNWALEGLTRVLLQDGKLEIPEKVQRFLREYRDAENPIRIWAYETLVEDPKGFVTSADLYESYKKWAKDRGYSPPNLSHFVTSLVNTLHSLGWHVERTKRTIDSTQKRGIAGISLGTTIDLSE